MNPTRSAPVTTAAFTLIELLIVIAIIGILSAILIPVIGHVRENALASECAGNLRQIQLANILYAQDHKGKYAPASIASDTDSERKWFINPNLYGYLSAKKAVTNLNWPTEFLCPTSVAAGNTPESQPNTYAGYSYGYNQTGLNTQTTAGYRQFTQSQVVRPATSLAFADAVDWLIEFSGSDAYDESKPTTKQTKAVAYRHGGKINAVYWDAHVRSLDRAEVVNNLRLWRVLQ